MLDTHFHDTSGGFSPAFHVPSPPPTAAADRIRWTSSGDCRPGIPRLRISSLAIRDVSRSRKVGAPATSASRTASTSSRFSPSAANRSTNSVQPTRPAARSTIATTLAHLTQILRSRPAGFLQYEQRMAVRTQAKAGFESDVGSIVLQELVSSPTKTMKRARGAASLQRKSYTAMAGAASH
jgi:hypothetical protein